MVKGNRKGNKEKEDSSENRFWSNAHRPLQGVAIQALEPPLLGPGDEITSLRSAVSDQSFASFRWSVRTKERLVISPTSDSGLGADI